VQPESKNLHKRRVMYCAGAGVFFFCIVFISCLYYRLQVNKLDYKEWDLKTVTIDDYSIELAIDDALFD
jgi:hypothetical protein